MRREDWLSNQLIGAAIEVHRHLGPGLLESVYETCVVQELTLQGIQVERQKSLPICYKGATLDTSYRLDLVLESLVIAEIKAVETLLPVHEAQLLTYLKLSGCRVGLLINFNVPLLKEGIKRLVHNY
jgi:GxxExxY protein